MKKLIILTFGLLFTAGMAYGQTSQDNTASSQQNGSNNAVSISQSYQSGASADQNKAKTKQRGDYNKIKSLSQVGAGNNYKVKQYGDKNVVDSHPKQGTNSYLSFDGELTINQYGKDNLVWDSDQAGSNNIARINQGDYGSSFGNNNVVNIEAQVSAAGGTGNKITIDQSGNGNAVGEASANGAGAYQEGAGNDMDIDQGGNAVAGQTDFMPSNFGTINNDFFHQSEGGQGLIQRGDDNELVIDQSSGNNVVGYVNQHGDLNDASISQGANAGGNYAQSVQVGASNSVSITQN